MEEEHRDFVTWDVFNLTKENFGRELKGLRDRDIKELKDSQRSQSNRMYALFMLFISALVSFVFLLIKEKIF